ncbi:unnamed protein product, partial [Mesorhabditis belari]|uniref:G-protein coupled receptors family 1 profile domain-containing protein n=1 Tax=Mesorhabditis belari TaxID=2138241 RepID=A0AAF3FDZ2_9BILA
MFNQLSLLCAALMNLFCVCGIVGNGLSLYIYSRKAFRKRSINVLLLALAGSDFFVCVLAIPVFSISQMQELVPGCQVVIGTVMLYFYPVTLMFQAMSVWMLVTITIDRYLAVCHPFIVQTYCTRTRALFAVGWIIIFSFLYNVCRFWEYKLLDCDSSQNRMRVEEILEPMLRSNENYLLWYQTIITLVSQFMLPLAVLCVLNFQVARTILAAGEQRRALVASERREHSTAKMMLFVVIVFIFCYTFSFILNVAETVNPTLFLGPLGFLLNDINNILIVFNSSTSFVFYVTYSTRYRAQLRKICVIRLFMENLLDYKVDRHIHHRSPSAEFSEYSKKTLNSCDQGCKKPLVIQNPGILRKENDSYQTKWNTRVTFDNF